MSLISSSATDPILCSKWKRSRTRTHTHTRTHSFLRAPFRVSAQNMRNLCAKREAGYTSHRKYFLEQSAIVCARLHELRQVRWVLMDESERTEARNNNSYARKKSHGIKGKRKWNLRQVCEDVKTNSQHVQARWIFDNKKKISIFLENKRLEQQTGNVRLSHMLCSLHWLHVHSASCMCGWALCVNTLGARRSPFYHSAWCWDNWPTRHHMHSFEYTHKLAQSGQMQSVSVCVCVCVCVRGYISQLISSARLIKKSQLNKDAAVL